MPKNSCSDLVQRAWYSIQTDSKKSFRNPNPNTQTFVLTGLTGAVLSECPAESYEFSADQLCLSVPSELRAAASELPDLDTDSESQPR